MKFASKAPPSMCVQGARYSSASGAYYGTVSNLFAPIATATPGR